MKILGRILFALAAALLLIFFHNFGTRLTADKYFAEDGKEIFMSNGPDKYRFFYGATGYHLAEPTYSFVVNQYQIQFFEINKVFINKEKDVKVEEFYYIMIDHPTNVLTIDNPQRYYLKFVTGDEPITLRIHQFREIPFSLVVNDEDKALITVNDLIGKGITKFELIDFQDPNETILGESNISFKEEDLVIKDVVTTNYNNKEVLNQHHIYTKYQIDASKYNYLYYLTIAVYFVFIGITTYFLYFFNKNRTRKNKPTPRSTYDNRFNYK